MLSTTYVLASPLSNILFIVGRTRSAGGNLLGRVVRGIRRITGRGTAAPVATAASVAAAAASTGGSSASP